jgi:hypothetical protein
MAYATTLDAPTRGQFEDPYRGGCWVGEPGAQVFTDYRAYDCGPTGVAYIDGCYNSRRLKIGYIRSLGAPECVGTSAPQVEKMLDALGLVSDQFPGPNLATIKNVVAGRRRPVLVAVRMGNIPPAYSGDSFTLNHWLVICANTTNAQGISGVVDMDSNAPASTGGYHFIPDWALENALLWDVPLVIPRYPMPALLPDTATEAYPVWFNNLKPATGTIVFKVGTHIYDQPGHVVQTVSSASSAPRIASLLHTDGTKYAAYILGTGGVRLVKLSEVQIK